MKKRQAQKLESLRKISRAKSPMRAWINQLTAKLSFICYEQNVNVNTVSYAMSKK